MVCPGAVLIVVNNRYHERALVLNEKNLHRIWDVSYDGYIGGKDCHLMDWNTSKQNFIDAMNDNTQDYNGPSIVALPMSVAIDWIPSPLILTSTDQSAQEETLSSPESFIQNQAGMLEQILNRMSSSDARNQIREVIKYLYDELQFNGESQLVKMAPEAAIANESTTSKVMYQGTSRWVYASGTEGGETSVNTMQGCGHHGPDYVGAAAVRSGKAMYSTANAQITSTIRSFP